MQVRISPRLRHLPVRHLIYLQTPKERGAILCRPGLIKFRLHLQKILHRQGQLLVITAGSCAPAFLYLSFGQLKARVHHQPDKRQIRRENEEKRQRPVRSGLQLSPFQEALQPPANREDSQDAADGPHGNQTLPARTCHPHIRQTVENAGQRHCQNDLSQPDPAGGLQKFSSGGGLFRSMAPGKISGQLRSAVQDHQQPGKARKEPGGAGKGADRILAQAYRRHDRHRQTAGQKHPDPWKKAFSGGAAHRLQLYLRICRNRNRIRAFIIKNLLLGRYRRQLPARMLTKIEKNLLLLPGLRVKLRGPGKVGDEKSKLFRLDPPVMPDIIFHLFQHPALFRHPFQVPLNPRMVVKGI